MSGIAAGRLQAERKAWRKDHPPEFVARPKSTADGATNLMAWECRVPGKKGTPWEGCTINLELRFTENYPIDPPKVMTVPILWHLNVWSSGQICLNLTNPVDDAKVGTHAEWHGQWKPSTTIRQILCAIQELLSDPYPAGARPEVQALYTSNRPAYEKRLKEEMDKYRTHGDADVIEVL